MSALISGIKQHSLAEQAGIRPGDVLTGVNGVAVGDIIDLSFQLCDDSVELQLLRQGQPRTVRIDKHPDEDLGLEFQSAVFDGVRTCFNRCIFCFVDQMIPGMRGTLYVKDDDYRLSFLYGNFITLTNMGEEDFQRIVRMHLTPIYVSVHATDAGVRCSMMQNKNAGDILEKLRMLIDNGIEVHTQIVCCPGYNDGKVLEKTYQDLLQLADGIASVAVVPVGLTKNRENLTKLRVFTGDEARDICRQVDEWQKDCRKKLGRSFIHLGDEFYLAAGLGVPPAETYDGYPQLENGIGLTRVFLDEWEEHFDKPILDTHRDAVVLAGESAAKVLQPLIAGFNKKYHTAHRVVGVKNCFFGGVVNVTGLLTGRDMLAEAKGAQRIIIPAVTLNKDNLFLDDMSFDDFCKKAGVTVDVVKDAKELMGKL